MYVIKPLSYRALSDIHCYTGFLHSTLHRGSIVLYKKKDLDLDLDVQCCLWFKLKCGIFGVGVSETETTSPTRGKDGCKTSPKKLPNSE